MVVVVPVLWWLMPFLIGLAYGHDVPRARDERRAARC